MIKYYIIDNATNETTEENREAFYESLIYNLDIAVDYGDMTTFDALNNLKFIMNQEAIPDNAIKSREVQVNGFTYNIVVED